MSPMPSPPQQDWRPLASALPALLLGVLLSLVGCAPGSSNGSGVGPTFLSVVPLGGSAIGGVPVTLIGFGFEELAPSATTITFGGVPAASIAVLHDTTMTCTPPAGTPGSTVDVVLRTPLGAITLAGAYSYHPLPSATSLAPPSGSSLGGELVTLTGTGFQVNFPGPHIVTFDGLLATGVSVLDDSTLTCLTPAGTAAKTVDVVVTNVNGSATLSGAFSNHLVPALIDVSVTSAPAQGGTSLALVGSGFRNQMPGTNTVLFGGIPASNVIVVNDTTLTCDTPAGTPGSIVDIEVRNRNGTGSLPGAFALHALPTIASLSPVRGAVLGGTSLSLTGTGFLVDSAGTNVITLDGRPLVNTVVQSDTLITCQTPGGSLGNTVDLVLSNANGSVTLPLVFTYVDAPAVTGIAPGAGAAQGATDITLLGSGFLNAGAGTNIVAIDGVAAINVVVASDTTLTCSTPSGPPGAVVDVIVTNNNGTDRLLAGYRFFGPPSIVFATPGVGSPVAATTVTVRGSGFLDDNPGANSVSFGALPATSVVVVDDATLTCVAPVGAAGTTVDLVVTNANGTALQAGGFRYASFPTLAQLTPSAAGFSGGASVTLNGSGFLADNAGTLAVTIGGVPATSITVLGDGIATCNVPPGTPGAAVAVAIANVNGNASLPSGFSYFPAPTLIQITPRRGTPFGGNTVTLLGSGFQVNEPGTQSITFAGVTATDVSVQDDSVLTCAAPPGTPGTVVIVEVTNVNGSARLANGYAYATAPGLSSVQPAVGSANGGTSVTLTGSGFTDIYQGSNLVTFGGVPASMVRVLSDSVLTCITPAHKPGPVEVIVSNANGSTPLPDAFTYTREASRSLSSVLVANAYGALADGSEGVLIKIALVDDQLQPVVGATVRLSASGSGNALQQPEPTDADGLTTGLLRTTVAEIKEITAIVIPTRAAASSETEVRLGDAPRTEFIWSVDTDFYVSTHGSDANSGSSPTHAWASMGKAAASLEAGDTVYVAPGTYLESITLETGGLPGRPMRFSADRRGERTGEQAGAIVIHGMGLPHTVRMSAVDHIVFEGFDLVGGAGSELGYGLLIDSGSTELTIRKNRFHDNRVGCLAINTRGLLFEDNTVSNNAGTGVELRGSTRVRLTNNLIYNNGASGSAFHTTSATIESNTIHSNGDAGVRACPESVVALHHNTITDNLGYGLEGTLLCTSSFNDIAGNRLGQWSGVARGPGDFSLDPLYRDPDGRDNLLGGRQGVDDRFQLDETLASPAFDQGTRSAHETLLSDGTHLGDRSSRLDGALEGTGADGAELNLGYHYPVTGAELPVLSERDGRLVHAGRQVLGDAVRRPRFLTWLDASADYASAGSGLPVGSTTGSIQWIVHQLSPLENREELIGLVSEDGVSAEFDVQRWSGSEWHLEWSTSIGRADHSRARTFDIEYEDASGDALVVYSNGGSTPVFRVRTRGVWSAEAALPHVDVQAGAGAVRWIELVCRPDHDQIALAYADENGALIALLWDGTRWDRATATLLQRGRGNAGGTLSPACRNFDLAFESVSGDLLVAWGNAERPGVSSAWKRRGSSTWTRPSPLGPLPAETTAYFVDLAAEPHGDRIAAGLFGRTRGAQQLQLIVWNGAAWVGEERFAVGARDPDDGQTGAAPGALAWSVSPATAIVVHAGEGSGRFRWSRWTPALGWEPQSSVPTGSGEPTRSLLLEPLSGGSELMCVLLDAGGALHAMRFAGGAWQAAGTNTCLPFYVNRGASLPFDFVPKPRAEPRMGHERQAASHD